MALSRPRLAFCRAALASIALASALTTADASASSAQSEATPLSPKHKAAATAAALVPGILLHGAGHFVAGDRTTAYRLLGAEAVGVGLALGGVGGMAAAGASRKLIGSLVTLTVAGGALLILPLLADLYGVLAPVGGTGSPPSFLPLIETQLGGAYVYDRIFAYRGFLVPGIDARLGAFRFSALGHFALNDTNARLRGEIAYRFLGPKTRKSAKAKDGSYIDLELALTHHRFTSNGFSLTTGEANLEGRLDLGRVAPRLEGSFAELGLGIGYIAHSYEGAGVEGEELLTPRFGFGMYLGHQETYPRGEVMAFYDHRHEGFAAGLLTPGLGSGMAGNFGANGRLYFSPTWGLSVEAAAGSAFFGRLSLLFRHGGKP